MTGRDRSSRLPGGTGESAGSRPEATLASRLLSGGAWAVLGKAVAAVAAIVANAVLARLLPPSDLGIYFLLLSLVLTLSTAAQLGMNYAVVRFTAAALGRGEGAEARHAMIGAIGVGLAGAACGFVFFALPSTASLIGRVFEQPPSAALLPLAGVWLFALAWQSLVAESFRGLHDIRMATLFGGTISSLVTLTIFATAIVIGTATLKGVVLLTAGAIVGVTAIGTLFLLGRLHSLPRNAGAIPLRQLLRAGFPLWITTMTFYVISQVDLWIVGAMRPAAEVAVYGAAARLVTTRTMPLLIVNAVLPPVIADLYGRRELAKLQATLQRTAGIAALPALAVMALLVTMGPQILALVYGDYYRSGWIVLVILGVGQTVNVLAGSCGMTLMMTGHQDTLMVLSVFSAVLMVGMAVLLGSHWGAVGIASAAAGGTALQNVLMWIEARRKTGLLTHATLRVRWSGEPT
jgi:O-antigen/teichoic acid export membrane protein